MPSWGDISFNSKTIIAQNGKNGIFIGRNPINYTGETNLLNIQDSFIIRNESHGIYGDIAGRGIIIQRTSFEYNGEPSDPKRQSLVILMKLFLVVYLICIMLVVLQMGH